MRYIFNWSSDCLLCYFPLIENNSNSPQVVHGFLSQTLNYPYRKEKTDAQRKYYAAGVLLIKLACDGREVVSTKLILFV